MSDSMTLTMNKRNVIGKKVKQLRNNGIIPGIVYGPNREGALAVQTEWSALRPVLIKAGGSELIELNVDGDRIPALIFEVHRHPVRGDVLHVDFYEVDMNATLRTHVPIVLLNMDEHSRAIDSEIFQATTSLEVECLPGNIPHQIEVDLSPLQEEGDVLTIADLPALEGVTYTADEEIVIARVVIPTALPEPETDEDLLEEGGEMGEVEVIGRQRDDEEEGEE